MGLLAQSAQGVAEGGGSLVGWYVGIAIGVVVVLVVVAVVLLIIDAASKIATQAGLAREALDGARANTQPLWDVAETNRTAMAVLEGAVRARHAVEGR